MNDFVDQFFSNDYLTKLENSFNVFSPKANISELEKHYIIEMLVPGFEKSDFQIEMEENQLKVSANRTEKVENEKDSSEVKYLHREFESLRMERSFRLGKAVNSESITANYQNGVLSIMLPKKEELNLKRLIEVK